MNVTSLLKITWSVYNNNSFNIFSVSNALLNSKCLKLRNYNRYTRVLFQFALLPSYKKVIYYSKCIINILFLVKLVENIQ